MLTAPCAKLEEFAARDNSPASPGCFAFGSKIVFVGSDDTLVFEMDLDVDTNRALLSRRIVLPFGHQRNPLPILIRQRGVNTLLAIATSPQAQFFFQQLELPSPQDQWEWEDLGGPNFATQGQFSCAFADTKILVSRRDGGIYMHDMRAFDNRWMPLNLGPQITHLPWDRRALVYGHRGDFLVMGYSLDNPWLLSIYILTHDFGELYLIREEPLKPLKRYPNPDNWTFAVIEDKKFCFIISISFQLVTHVIVYTFEILSVMEDDVHMVCSGMRQFEVFPQLTQPLINGRPCLLGAFIY
ncbi:PREDICTED: uncharacterized protein LOC101309674 [Fragaria vesca subsp. vesca]|uniref:uncharacterized protein LOC101309674 n=1 Tax=Fragaria vesca subsp. vesca TaxID=101020 RepID=UPI0002C2E578|nr:PREDICTED: uncharacterized protein LOC101309674 [Fragaria vesca subsp. vesca]